MTFYPDGSCDNATLVSTASVKQGVTNPDYKSELESYLRDKDIAAIMRQRTSVCG